MGSTSGGKAFSLTRYHSFIKFGVVGAVGIAVNEGLLLAFQAAGVYLLLASVLAIEISIVSNFFMNDLWTFKDRRSGTMAARFTKFNALMLAGLVVNVGVLDAGVDYLGMVAAIANLLGIAAAFLFRYGLSVKYAWMRTESIEGAETPIARPAAEPATGPAQRS